MSQPIRKSSLSPARARLIEWMQGLGFGTIKNLVIRGGEPVLDPPPDLIFDVKLDGDEGPRPEYDLNDFVLKKEVQNLFARFDAIGDGTIRRIEVRHGLPCRMRVKKETR